MGIFGGMGPAGPSLLTEFFTYEVSGLAASRFELTGRMENGVVELQGVVPDWEGRSAWWFERSADRVDFQALGEAEVEFPRLPGEHVEGMDWEPKGNEAWYRMAVLMEDGRVEHSQVVHVRLDGEKGMDIGPVPAGDRLWLTPFGFERGEEFTIRIMDLQGKVLVEKRKVWSESAFEVATEQLFPGVYHVNLQGPKETITKKFIKM